MPKFTAAIFDMDNTITESQPLHLNTFNKVLEPHGVEIDKETWCEIYEGTSGKFILEDVLTKRGLLNKVDIMEMLEKRDSLFRQMAFHQLVPIKGFARFFNELKMLGIPSIVGTNGHSENVDFALKILELEEEQRITREDVPKSKPDPAIYLEATKRLGKNPEECIVFEDSVAGVLAAKRAGCYCIALLTTTSKARLEEAGADLIIDDYTKISTGLLFT
jgi:beta-phosphoglucomutase